MVMTATVAVNVQRIASVNPYIRGNAVVIDLTPERNTRNRAADKRTTVTATLPWPIASRLDEAVERLQTNRNKLIIAALDVGIPLVEAQVKAASAGRQK